MGNTAANKKIPITAGHPNCAIKSPPLTKPQSDPIPHERRKALGEDDLTN
jgi:hypothetical protein